MSATTSPSDGSEPALVFDARSVFDRGFYASLTSDELAHLPRDRAAACAALMVLLPLLSGARLDLVYRRAVFCWDGARKTAKPRKPKPPGFDEALNYFRGLLPALVGGAHVTPPEHEGDDAVATAAVREAAAGRSCCVVSGDKDLQQLVSRRVAYYCLNRKSLLSPQFVMEQWKIQHPSHLAVWLAVVGDPGDGIAGVHQWGKVKMGRLLEEIPAGSTLEQVIERVVAAIPRDQAENFYQSLNDTLLNVEVPGIPEPALLNPAPLAFLEDEGLEHINNMFARFVGEFRDDPDARSAVDSNDDEREY